MNTLCIQCLFIVLLCCHLFVPVCSALLPSAFALLLPLLPRKFNLTLCAMVYALAAICMFVPIVKFDFWWVFVAFLSLEALLGMYNTVGATLRSVYYPDTMHASVMSVFRLPLNLLVVYGTMLTNSAKDMHGLQSVYTGITCMHAIAFILQFVMYFFPVPKYAPGKKSN